MTNFDCKLLQVAWFHSGASQPHAQEVFRSAFGEEPENVQSNRVPSQAAPFLSQAKGQIDGVEHGVTVLAGRVDILVQARDPQTSPEQEAFPTIDGKEYLAKLKAVTASRNIAFDSCYRQALVCDFVTKFDDRQKANQNLFTSCGIKSLDDQAIDVAFQYNVRKKLSTNFVLNRFISHSIEQMQMFQISGAFPGSGPAFQFNPEQHEPTFEFYAHIEKFDFNNVPLGHFFSPNEQKINLEAIFDEVMLLREGQKL